MNSFRELKSIIQVECDSNQTEIVLLIYFKDPSTDPNDELRLSLVPFIRKNNYKIILYQQDFPSAYGTIASDYSASFLFIKKHLKANQKVKIICFGHLKYIWNCETFINTLNQLKMHQLPYNPDNLGLVLLENGENEKLNNLYTKDDRLDLAMLPNLEYVFVKNALAWDHCVDLSYRVLECEQYGCPAIKILTKKDLSNQFTNILLVKMTKSGQLLEGREKLEAFINDRLKFTNLTKHDVQLFQPITFKKLTNFYEHRQKLCFQHLKYVSDAIVSLVKQVNSTSIFETLDNSQKGYKAIILEHYFPAYMKKRSKRQSSQEAVGADESFGKMLTLVFKICMRSDLFSVRILNAMLELLNEMDLEYDRKKKQTICDQKTAMPGNQTIAEEWPRDAVLVRSFDVLYQIFWDNYEIKILEKNMQFEVYNEWNTQFLRLLRVDCEKIFQNLIREFTNNWYTKTERIETAVDRLTEKLTQWADNVPIYGNETITWDNFRNWTGTDAILASGINVTATKYVFNKIKNQIRVSENHWKLHQVLQADFHWMVRNMLYVFNRNVTTVAIQQLASSKLDRIDALVAVLDHSFMIGIRNLHHSIDQEQWLTIRPPIFNYLHRLQQQTVLFEHFLMDMKIMFDIHHIDMPMTPYERLQVINAEFDVYQQRMGGYVNGTINTTQQWARKLHQTTEYMFANSGVQQKSFINGAVKWIKDELVCKQKPTWSGFEFGGTLVFLNLIVRKWFK
jgi:hypothetical protein